MLSNIKVKIMVIPVMVIEIMMMMMIMMIRRRTTTKTTTLINTVGFTVTVLSVITPLLI